jgi:hypothetical protein
VVQWFVFSIFGFPFWLLTSRFCSSICANQRKSVAEKVLPLRSSVVQGFWFSVFGFPFWLLASGFASSICANQRKSVAEKFFPLRSSVSSVVQGFWFSILDPDLCSGTLFSFCNLAGKDAGQNNTKMLRGLNAEC